MKTILTILLIFLSFKGYNQTKNDSLIKSTKYLLFERNDPLLNFYQSKDTSRTGFFIYFDKFKTKASRDEYVKNFKQRRDDRRKEEKRRGVYSLNKEEMESFGCNYANSSKPTIITLTENDIIYTVEDLSIGKVHLGSIAIFIENIGNGKYLAYKAFLMARE